MIGSLRTSSLIYIRQHLQQVHAAAQRYVIETKLFSEGKKVKFKWMRQNELNI